MSENDLFDQLFSTKNDNKEEKQNLLNNLFSMQINPLSQSKSSEKKKKKREEDDVHEYIKLAERSNEKAKKSVQNWKDERTMTAEQMRQKKQFEKVTAQFDRTKKSVASSQAPKKKEYLPNIINPFEKPEKKVEKPKTTASTASTPSAAPTQATKKEAEKPKEREAVKLEKERVPKVEMKQEKIKRKEIEKEIQKEKAVPKVERRQEPKEKERERDQRQKKAKPAKKRDSSSSSSSSGSSNSAQGNEAEFDWQKQLRQITKYNPSDEKFKKRDKYDIKQSGIERMFGQDKFSSRMGKLQQEQDLRMQMQMKHKKHHHHHKHH